MANVSPGFKNTTYTLMDPSKKVLICPLDNTVHMSSFALFEGHDDSYDHKKAAQIVKWSKPMLPEGFLSPEETHKKWCCFRPLTPDDLPVVGKVEPLSNLYINSGHGSKGWTTGVGTSKLLSDIMSGRAPDIDPSPFCPMRFRLWS